MNLSNIYSKLAYFVFRGYGLVHPIQKKVVFSSFFGKQYSDNPRAICEKMHELYPDYELVWLLNNKENELIPDYVRIVAQSDGIFAWGKEITTAASYVYNVEIKTRIFRKKQQSFIQTWHGDRGVKKILKQRNPSLEMYDHKLTTLCVAGSEFGKNLYHSAFGYYGHIMESGCPRNDCLIVKTESKKIETKKRLGIPQDCKVLLYAPTFRDNAKDKPQICNINIVRTLDSFPSNENWVCLIRAHVASAGIEEKHTDKRIYNVTSYPDMADILGITDCLITDYSSCAMDFAITGRPLILALFDKEEYERDCREFSSDPVAAGFVIAYNQAELEEKIQTVSLIEYEEANKRVNNYYGVVETGHSAEDVCEYIDSFYRENNKSK